MPGVAGWASADGQPHRAGEAAGGRLSLVLEHSEFEVLHLDGDVGGPWVPAMVGQQRKGWFPRPGEHVRAGRFLSAAPVRPAGAAGARLPAWGWPPTSDRAAPGDLCNDPLFPLPQPCPVKEVALVEQTQPLPLRPSM